MGRRGKVRKREKAVGPLVARKKTVLTVLVGQCGAAVAWANGLHQGKTRRNQRLG